MVKKPLNWSGNGTPFCRGETSARNRFWMITESAKLAEEQGHEARAAQRPERQPLHQHGRDHRRDQRRHDLHEKGAPRSLSR